MALGIAGGVSLAVGLASLPFRVGPPSVQSLIWALRGGPAAMALTCFGAALAATSLLFCHSHFRRRHGRPSRVTACPFCTWRWPWSRWRRAARAWLEAADQDSVRATSPKRNLRAAHTRQKHSKRKTEETTWQTNSTVLIGQAVPGGIFGCGGGGEAVSGTTVLQQSKPHLLRVRCRLMLEQKVQHHRFVAYTPSGLVRVI